MPSVGRNILDAAMQRVSCTQGFVVSTMPRGTLSVVQPGRLHEGRVREYGDDLHRLDRLSWDVVRRHKVLRASDVWGKEFEGSGFCHSFLRRFGLRRAVAAPIGSPLFAGYPGVVMLGRAPEDPDFSDDDMDALTDVCGGATAKSRKVQEQWADDLPGAGTSWAHAAPVRFFVLDQNARPVYPSSHVGLDARLQQQMAQRTLQCVEQLSRGYAFNDRVMLPDTWGDIWVFHCVAYADYPALGSGRFVVFTLQPEAEEWAEVKPADVAADPEIVRLLPSVQYMYQQFHQTPTLGQIAKKSRLSAFHFHRRFADLIGQTPKHFMLSCQVMQAKRLLLARRRELKAIASDCGFAHQSHFTSRFKQATGLTPTRWRRLAVKQLEVAEK